MKRKKDFLKIYDVLNVDEPKIIQDIYTEYAPFFDKAVEVLKLAYNVAPLKGKSVKSKIHPHVQRTLLALYTASFRFFRSVIILCKSGLGSEALVQLRSLLETISYLLYIAEKDYDDRLNYYLHSRAISWKVGIEQFLEVFPKDTSSFNTEWYERKYNEAIQYFRSKHGKEINIKDIKEKYTLRADIAAQSTEDKIFINHYKTFHRLASAIGHGEDIFEYIKPTTEPHKFFLKFIPITTDKWIKFCLAQGMVIMFLAIKRINELLGLEENIAINNLDTNLASFIEDKYTNPILKELEEQKRKKREEGDVSQRDR